MSDKPALDRRDFLKTAAATSAAALTASHAAAAEPQQAAPPAQATAPVAPREVDPSGSVEVLTTDRPGGDFMVDVLKTLDFEYIASNPGSSFRGIHESIINYGNNRRPSSSPAATKSRRSRWRRATSRSRASRWRCSCHGTVGMQHAAMAIYNAFCDRVPIYVLAGNTLDATLRRPGVEWEHSVQDAAAMVRDFVKWDDQPVSLPHFAESAVRAYKIAMTPPMMPVLVVIDGGLQEDPISRGDLAAADSEADGGDAAAGRFGRRRRSRAAAGQRAESGHHRRSRRTHAGGHHAAHRAGRDAAGTGRGSGRPHELPVASSAQSDERVRATRHRRRRHPRPRAHRLLGHRQRVARCRWSRTSRSLTKPGTKLISITATDLSTKGNYQDFQRYPEVDVAMAADAEATLPALIEACKRLITADRRAVLQERGAKFADANATALQSARGTRRRTRGTPSPISTARLLAELWAQIKDEDWSLVAESGNISDWTFRLWNFDKHYQHLGDSGGAGVGYGAPASVGGALANKKHGRLSITIQGDGDFMYAPGVWWTAAHHKIPLLAVMHNNRAYHQEVMHIQRMADRHNRGITQRAHRHDARPIRTSITPRSRRGWACTRRDRSPTRTISGRRSSARSTSSSAASRRSSTSSRSRGNHEADALVVADRRGGFSADADGADRASRRSDPPPQRLPGMPKRERSCSSATAAISVTATRRRGRAPPDRVSVRDRSPGLRSAGTSVSRRIRCRRTRRKWCRMPISRTSTRLCSRGPRRRRTFRC